MITIRPATIADTGAIVHLEMTIIDQMQIPMVEKLGRDNIEQLLHDSALADDTARYSHKHATVAEMSGAIVGVIQRSKSLIWMYLCNAFWLTVLAS